MEDKKENSQKIVNVWDKISQTRNEMIKYFNNLEERVDNRMDELHKFIIKVNDLEERLTKLDGVNN